MKLRIDNSTRLAGLLGFPVRHSLSPAIHNRAFEAAGLNWVYLAFSVAPADLPAAVKGARVLGLAGFNLTHPHKQAVIPLLDRLSPEAEAIGAVNTVVFREGEAMGFNTDATGFAAFLREEGFDLRGKTVAVAGAGGAGRAVCWAAARGGAARVAVFDIDPGKARALGRDLDSAAAGRILVVGGVKEQEEAFSAAELVVNATPVGMKKGDPPVVSAKLLSRGAWFVDLIYNPPETATLREVRSRGREGRNGLGMLVHQAAASWEIWTGKKAPLEAMRSALEADSTSRPARPRSGRRTG